MCLAVFLFKGIFYSFFCKIFIFILPDFFIKVLCIFEDLPTAMCIHTHIHMDRYEVDLRRNADLWIYVIIPRCEAKGGSISL